MTNKNTQTPGKVHPDAQIFHNDVEIRDALRWIADILTWSQIPFFVLGDLVEQMARNQPASLRVLEIGVMNNSWNDVGRGLIKTFFLNTPYKDTDVTNGMNIEYNGVPIKVRVIKRKYGFLKNLDFMYFWNDTYNVPNPWYKYMKARWIVK